ncbi:MAG: hypoxanthine phosphoribosyltransferase [Bacteroidetes bacterium]|nr:hypoxanthine phosphoribosyltransferase [Bacteroidota bacterium]MCL5025061.1 hypoxanthine phosphoribosyltransferase [Chloroflexota bacterium]
MAGEYEVLLSEEVLQRKVQELGRQITADYRGKRLLLVGVLKGAVVFIVDLARNIDLPLEIDFMAVSSYGASTETSGVVRIIKDLEASLQDKDVLIVEDIVDTGLTLDYLRQNLLSRSPASLRICALLNKRKERKAPVPLDYVGFEIEDQWVVGYGLDSGELHRNLPYIGLVKDAQPLSKREEPCE